MSTLHPSRRKLLHDFFAKKTKPNLHPVLKTPLKTVSVSSVDVLFETLPQDRSSVVLELGVGEGNFASKLLANTPDIVSYVGVDLWAHDLSDPLSQPRQKEIEAVQKLLSGYGSRAVIFMDDFLKVKEHFSEKTFDLMFIDGGVAPSYEIQEQWLWWWWSRCKIGGVFAGMGLGDETPQIVDAVVTFAAKRNLRLHTVENSGAWWIVK